MGSDGTWTFPMTYQPDGCLWTPFPAASFPCSLHTKNRCTPSPLNPSSFSVPKCYTVMSACFKFHHISVSQDLVGALSGEAEVLSPFYLGLSISILALYWISIMFSFHKWGEWLRAVKLPEGIIQYYKMWVSLFLDPYLIVAHKQKLLSTQHHSPQHQKEMLRLPPMYSYCVAHFAAKGPMQREFPPA